MNAKDVRCVSWILRNITDPESLDAAIRLAGTIRWFIDGINVEPPYDIIVSTFHTCFDSTGTVYPGLLDRAYYSARAIFWIRIRAKCGGGEFEYDRRSLPHVSNNGSNNKDLDSILEMYTSVQAGLTSIECGFTEHNTADHMQWVSCVLLHSSWAQWEYTLFFTIDDDPMPPHLPWNAIPLDATLDLLSAWPRFLNCPIQEEAQKIQDKTYVISHFSLHAT